MPAILLFLFLIFAQPLPLSAQTPPKTIKLGSFTPVPTKIPTATPIPSYTPIPTSPPFTIPTLPPPGQEPTPDPGSVDVIIDLVNQIKRYCGGKIFPSNVDCISKLKLPGNIAALVQSPLYKSVIGQGALQCVGFVRAAVPRKYGTTLNNGGHAIQFSVLVPSGYTFLYKTARVKIRIDDIPIWNYDTYGHIAYVINIIDANTFQVAEANWNCTGCVGFRSTTVDNPALIGWLRRRI